MIFEVIAALKVRGPIKGVRIFVGSVAKIF